MRLRTGKSKLLHDHLSLLPVVLPSTPFLSLLLSRFLYLFFFFSLPFHFHLLALFLFFVHVLFPSVLNPLCSSLTSSSFLLILLSSFSTLFHH